MHFKYFTFFAFHPRGNSKTAILSKGLVGKCKNGDIDFNQRLAERIIELNLSSFFDNAILVPIPRSTPIKKDSLFPAKVIAETLVRNSIGNDVSACLERIRSVKTSHSNYSSDTRPSVDEHIESMRVTPQLISEPTIILIDDVFTLGRTAMASAKILQKSFPDKEIKIFCPFRTRGFSNYPDILIDIKHDEMTLSPYGKVILPD